MCVNTLELANKKKKITNCQDAVLSTEETQTEETQTEETQSEETQLEETQTEETQTEETQSEETQTAAALRLIGALLVDLRVPSLC